MNYIKKSFNELTLLELYGILQLRNQVFVVEQNAPYQDLDDLDQVSIHYMIEMDGKIVSYLRTIPYGHKFQDAKSIGRVVTDILYRNRGYQRFLIEQAIKDIHIDDKIIRIEGQAYLKRYYESFGFVVKSGLFLIDGIDHYTLEYEKKIRLGI